MRLGSIGSGVAVITWTVYSSTASAVICGPMKPRTGKAFSSLH